MKVWLLLALLSPSAMAEDCRVLIDGTGCHTPQLAIQRILEKLPEVRDVTILPRNEAPADNQRIFVIRSSGKALNQEQVVAALGRRAKFYRVLSVTEVKSSEK